MSQILGLMTAYGAVAILAWLAVLLYPQRIPAAAAASLPRRWRWAGGFALALAATLAFAWLAARGLLPFGDSLAARMAGRLVTYTPLIGFILARRSRSAVLLPQRGLLPSLAIGGVIALFALAAFASVTGSPDSLPALAASLTRADALLQALRAALFGLALAALLALLADGWSKGLALAAASIANIAVHLVLALPDGLDGRELFFALAAGAIALGLFSALLANRNLALILPAHIALAMAMPLPG